MKRDIDPLSFRGSIKYPERSKSLEAFLQLLLPENKRQDGVKTKGKACLVSNVTTCLASAVSG